MDLNFILSKTKDTSDKTKRNREPVNIATEDRPYDLLDKEYGKPERVQNIREKDINSIKTNRKQTVNKVTTNRKQTVNKVTTNRKQTVNKVTTNRKQTVNKVDSKPITNENKKITFSVLVGLQKLIIILIYEECKKTQSKITEPLTLEYISSQTGSGKNTVKTNIYRLSIKKYLVRHEFKNGRGGWTKYELAEDIFHELFQLEREEKLVTNRKQTVNKVDSKPITNPLLLSSSSFNTTTSSNTELPENWLKVDLSNAAKFGLKNEHLVQLYKSGIPDAKIVEDSIEFFLFDLENNNKSTEIKKNPLSYFMGIMKRGGLYSAPENYRSQKEMLMQNYLEHQKRLREKELEVENQIFDMECQKWLESLSEEEKEKLIPDDLKHTQLSGAKISALRLFFKKTFWYNIKNQMFNT